MEIGSAGAATRNAAVANEINHAIGQDIYTSCELAEWEETEAAEGEAERQALNVWAFDYFYS